MPMKRRIPKDRTPEITPEAVELFARCTELQELGVDEVGYDSDVDGYAEEREEYLSKFHRLCWGLLDCVGSADPLSVQHEADRTGEPELYIASIPRALELRRQLLAAVRQRGRRKVRA